MNFDTETIIDSNGQKYRAGWDEYGWFTIVRVEQHPETGEWVKPENATLESFAPDAAEKLVAAIEETL